MSIRGEYELEFDNGEKLILPNRLTLLGLGGLLSLGFRNVGPAVLSFGMTNLIDYSQSFAARFNQPTLGVNGYAQSSKGRSASGWESLIRFTEDEAFISTTPIRFNVTGGGWDAPVNRAFMFDAFDSAVWSVSSAFPDGPRIMTASFNLVYRVWMR